jgi:WhiB family redox-sensing transcriptional regulator
MFAVPYQPWRDEAACRSGVDPELFFPVFEAGLKLTVRRAKAICQACPVQSECLDEALAVDEKFGIFGGVHFGQGALRRKGVRDALRRERGVELRVDPEDDFEHGTEAGAKRHSRLGEKACPECSRAAYWARVRRDEMRAAGELG